METRTLTRLSSLPLTDDTPRLESKASSTAAVRYLLKGPTVDNSIARKLAPLRAFKGTQMWYARLEHPRKLGPDALKTDNFVRVTHGDSQLKIIAERFGVRFDDPHARHRTPLFCAIDITAPDAPPREEPRVFMMRESSLSSLAAAYRWILLMADPQGPMFTLTPSDLQPEDEMPPPPESPAAIEFLFEAKGATESDIRNVLGMFEQCVSGFQKVHVSSGVRDIDALKSSLQATMGPQRAWLDAYACSMLDAMHHAKAIATKLLTSGHLEETHGMADEALQIFRHLTRVVRAPYRRLPRQIAEPVIKVCVAVQSVVLLGIIACLRDGKVREAYGMCKDILRDVEPVHLALAELHDRISLTDWILSDFGTFVSVGGLWTYAITSLLAGKGGRDVMGEPKQLRLLRSMVKWVPNVPEWIARDMEALETAHHLEVLDGMPMDVPMVKNCSKAVLLQELSIAKGNAFDFGMEGTVTLQKPVGLSGWTNIEREKAYKSA